MVIAWLLVGGLLLFSSQSARAEGAIDDAQVVMPKELPVGQAVTAFFDLKGYELPSGSYASINLKYLARPEGEKPMVRTGYPKTGLTFRTPGTYRILFILNEVSKPSCGGVDAKLLLEQEVKLFVQ